MQQVRYEAHALPLCDRGVLLPGFTIVDSVPSDGVLQQCALHWGTNVTHGYQNDSSSKYSCGVASLHQPPEPVLKSHSRGKSMN